jgi:AmpD protein
MSFPLVEPTALWQDGWYGPANRMDSPNFGARPKGACIDLVVIHSIRGLQVSAHFFIRRDGTLIQFVSANDRAWHAGQSEYRGRPQCNDDSIGIELEGLEGDIFTEAQYVQLARLCQDLHGPYPIAHVAGHEHVAPERKQDPGPGFAWERFKKLLNFPDSYFP